MILRTVMPIAEEAGLGYIFIGKYFTAEGLWIEMRKDMRMWHPRTINQYWRVQFRKIYAATIGLCKSHAPQHLRHTELLALCQLNNWQTHIENERSDEFVRSLFSPGFFDKWS
jgi:hypothetical protein